MAQLKNSVVSGSLRVTDDALADSIQTNKIKIPSTSGGSTYGVGTDGQVIKSNGTTVYWANENNPTVNNGTFKIQLGGTDKKSFTANSASNVTANFVFSAGTTPSTVTKKTVVTGGTTTDVPNITSVGSTPTLGTAIAADDITAWTTNTPTVVTKKTVVTSATFNTVVTGCTKKTVVTSASGATATYSNGVLTLTDGSFGTGDSVTVTTGASGSATTGDSCTVTAGTAASLSYTARSIPNITDVGSTPTLGTAIKAYTSLTTGDSVTVTAGTAPSLSIS